MFLKLSTFLFLVIQTSYGFYEDSKYVKTMNQIDLLKLHNDISDDIWLVQFYRTSEEEDMANTSKAFETTAKAMDGYAKIGAVDVDKHPLLILTLKLSSFPSYGFYAYYKYLPDVFGNFDRIKAIQDEVTRQMGYVFEERSIFRFVDDKRNYELGTTDMDYRVLSSEKPWGIIYYNPESESLKAADEWKLLLNSFNGVIQFGSVNNPLYKVLPVEDVVYPAVQYYSGGVKDNVIPDNYTGKMDYFSLFEYFKDKLPEPKAVRVIDVKSAQDCLIQIHCIFAFLPKQDHCNNDCVEKNLLNLNSAAKEMKLQPIYWAWNVFDEQPGLEQVFALEQCKHPVLVFINLQIGKYAKVDTDEIKADVIKKIMERRDDEATFPHDAFAVEVPEIKVLEEYKKNLVKDEL